MLLSQKLYKRVKAPYFSDFKLRVAYCLGFDYLLESKKLSRILRLTGIGAVVSALLLTTLPPVPASATPLNWLDSQTYGLSEISSTSTSVTLPGMSFGNECNLGKLITRQYQVTLTWPYFLSEQSSGDCIMNYPYGKMTNTGYLQFNGTSVAGKKLRYNSNSDGFIGIPNSPHVLEQAGGYGSQWGLNYAITRDFQNSINMTQSSDKFITYKLNRPHDGIIKDKAGNNIPLNGTFNYSDDGRWLVTNAPNKGMVRVDLDTLEVLPFAPAFCILCGYFTDVQSAITNDGRWVFVRNEGHFKVYDLSTCGPVPNTITTYVNCQSKNLYGDPALTGIGPNRTAPYRMKFVTDDVLKFYVDYGTGSPRTRGTFLMGIQGQSLSGQEYLALGDSFASGEGAHNYISETDTPENKCHLSTKSYPYLIKEQLDINSFRSIACSGARMEHITDLAQNSQTPNPNSLAEWLPGEYAQFIHVKRNNPEVITVSISGNDIDFAGKIKRCVDVTGIPSTCFNSYKDRSEITKEINSKYDSIKDTFEKIKTSAKSNTKIYVTGYPKIAGSGSCANNARLNATEIDLSNKIADHLNYAVEQAAIAAGVKYIDSSTALSGHRLCETRNVAVNGLTAGNDTYLIFGKESYHPNYLGQQLLRDKVLDLTNDFQSYSLASPATAVRPSASSTTALALVDGFSSGGETIRIPQYSDELIEDAKYHEDSWEANISGSRYGLKPSTSYQVEIHSSPVSLGSFATDANGDLEIDTEIPDTIDPGIHTVHVFGDNVAGEPIDVYKTIAIGVSDTDFDDDSVLNENEECIIGDPAEVDDDEDGIDDACDGYIDYPTSQVSQLYRARNGDTGNGEPADRIYIERKVNIAENLFGVEDHDLNEDGWSLVGVSDAGTDGQISNYELKDIDLTINPTDRFIPLVSIRHPEKGCTQLRPELLSEVEDSQTRDVEIYAEDTSTCRSQPEDDDVDEDSTPDNEQVLYRARYGDSGSGEDSSKIYVERNLTAAEAVLGRSDYDANDDGWSVIGISEDLSGGTFNTLILADPSDDTVSTDGAFTSVLLELGQEDRRNIKPIILYRDSSNDCHAITPEDLTTVKLNQTRGTDEASAFNGSCI